MAAVIERLFPAGDRVGARRQGEWGAASFWVCRAGRAQGRPWGV